MTQAASEAIAACEVVARLKGNFGERNVYSESVDSWVQAHAIQPSGDLILKANSALDAVLSDKSELRQLWEESESYSDWQASIDDLRRRLNF